MALAVLPLAAGRQRLRHQRLRGRRPAVRHPRRRRRADRRPARARHEARHGPRGQPHQRRAPWFVECRRSTDSPKRDWYWWRPAAPGPRARRREGAEPTNWRSFFSGPAWELDETTGEYYLHLFTRKQPDLNWENPEVRQAVYAMMRRWVDRGVDGFRMDVINMISKRVGPDGSLPDGGGTATSGSFGGDQFLNGPRIHEFLQEMNAAVRPCCRRASAHHRRGDPGHARRGRPALHRPRPRGGRHGLHLRAHGPRQPARRLGKWDLAPLSLPDLKANLTALAGRPGRGRLELACTGTTTTSRGSSRAGATTARTAWPARSPGARCCTCCAGRRTSTRARSWA